MHISIRSQMIAGVAAIGATAVAITPISQTELLPALRPVTANIALAATTLVNPITAVGTVLGDLNTNIFSQATLPGRDQLFWPDSFYSTTTGFEWLYAPGYYGIIPNFVNQAGLAPQSCDSSTFCPSGAVAGFVNNLSGYTWAGFNSVGDLGGGVVTALFNSPFAVVTALGQLASGDTQGAVDTLTTQIVDPLQKGLQSALNDIGYILDNIVTSTQIVLTSFIPNIVSNLITTVTGGIGYMASSLGATFSAVVTALSTGDLAGAWNATVEGLLGRTGTLGQLEKLTFGIGIVQDVNYGTEAVPDIVPTVVVPSLRSSVNTALQRLGDYKAFGWGGITNDPLSITPSPLAAAKTAAATARTAAPAASEVTAPVAESVTPAPESADSTPASAGAETGDANSAAPSAKPGKRTAPSHRSAPRAARGAAN